MDGKKVVRASGEIRVIEEEDDLPAHPSDDARSVSIMHRWDRSFGHMSVLEQIRQLDL